MSWWIKINGTVLPKPVSAPFTEYDIDSAQSGRPESGYMHRERIRRNVSSIQITWQHLTVEEAKLIRNALAPVSFTAEIRFLGETITRKMYAGDRNWEADFTDNGKTERWNLSVQLSEN